MKIKAVCELTELTDRTIRYYIEEKLISPAYTENYLGRKSFEFSKTDVEKLKNISVFRKFDFTIEEIRQIIHDANTSSAIIANVRQRTEQSVTIGQEKLQVLLGLSNERTYTFEQLAEELSKPKLPLPEHNEPIKLNPLKFIFSLLKYLLIFVIVWGPIVLSLLEVIHSIRDYHYPVWDHFWIVLTLVSFWPSFSVLFISKVKWKWKKIAKAVLLVFCVLGIPCNLLMSMGIVTHSETTDIRNYRRLDADCLANRHSFYQELFPEWPHYFVGQQQPDGTWEDVYLDAHYYYRNLPAFDYTYDIYAQWPLEKEAFDKEVARVTALYESDAIESVHFSYDIIQKGNYTCLFYYDGNVPFQEETTSYTYYIFAYDETNLVVRYIMCDSLENGADQPYYLSLDW